MSAWSSATAPGTARYAERHAGHAAPHHFRPLAGLTISSIGLGTYLGDCAEADDARYEEAAFRCMAGGINLLDTAINYRCQRSERALGRALRRAAAAGVTAREEVVVCTKGGYVPLEEVPPARPEDYVSYVRRRFIEPGICRPAELAGGRHCLAPAFLRDQVAASRANLGVDAIDVYYLHNPEAQLRFVDRGEVLDRIRAAMATLEALCDDGWITLYGIATWDAFRSLPDAREHLSLRALVGLARDVAGADHRFRVVQLPYNVVMPEAALAVTQDAEAGRAPLLEVARELGIAVIASASLLQARLVQRLPLELRAAFPGLRTDAQRALHFARSTPGVACALVGMRAPAHVAENLDLVRIPPTPTALKRLLGR